MLEQAQIGALILIGRFRVPSLTGRTSDYVGMVNEVVPELAAAAAAGELNSTRFPHLRHVIFIPPHDDVSTPTPPGMWRWDDLLTLAEQTSPDDLRNRQAQCGPDDVVNIQYTSGTTGNPKGAMLTHHNLLSNALHVGDAMEMDEHDRLCIPVPFYHCFGCVMGSLNCVVHGSTMIIPAERFDPSRPCTPSPLSGAPPFHGVPTMFIAQLGHPEFTNLDLSSLRTGIMAGSPCPIEVMREVIDRMGADRITIAYGQPRPRRWLPRPSPTTVSSVASPPWARFCPAWRVRLVDPETGLVVGPGQQGELQTRSANVMKGYFNMPEATADAIDADGWLHTGDLARRRDGYYKITGRLKDMIIRGGENIYPARSRSSCTATRRSTTCRSSACPTSGSARRSWPGSASSLTRTPPKNPSATSALARSPITRSPVTSSSPTSSHDRNRQDPEVPHARDGSGRVGPANSRRRANRVNRVV